ncbi:hypothetical protein ACKI1H_14620 [Pseudomonas sp. YH-1]|uniref:hypothetical protein n=1 Tax=Pseudomonas sp. YH-1 TaxID=3384787 RepID=UPI003F819D0F
MIAMLVAEEGVESDKQINIIDIGRANIVPRQASMKVLLSILFFVRLSSESFSAKLIAAGKTINTTTIEHDTSSEKTAIETSMGIEEKTLTASDIRPFVLR